MLRRLAAVLLLAAAALGARMAAVEMLSASHAAPVSYEHGEIARNLLAGRGFTVRFLGVEGPTSQQAPFYPALLAAAYHVYGVDSPEAHRAVEWLQCVVGTLTVLGVFWLARSLCPSRPGVAWTAALAAAVYPPHVYMVTHLQVAVWATAGLVLIVAVASEPRWQGSRFAAITVGVLAGGLLAIEPILALALPVVAWVVSRGGEEQRLVSRLGVAALVPAAALLVIGPWLARGALVHGELVFVKSTLGYAFWQGNNPLSWGTDKIPKATAELLRQDHGASLADRNRALWEARHETLYIDDVLLKPHGYERLAGLSEPARSRLLGREAWDYVATHPRHYAELCLRRLRYFLLFDETHPKAADPFYRWSTATWLVLVLVGLLVAREHWPALAATMVLFGLVTFFHALVITAPRFRMPIEPLSFVWAAFALAPLGDRWVRRLRPAQPLATSRPGACVLQGPHTRLRKSTSRVASRPRTDL